MNWGGLSHELSDCGVGGGGGGGGISRPGGIAASRQAVTSHHSPAVAEREPETGDLTAEISPPHTHTSKCAGVETVMEGGINRSFEKRTAERIRMGERDRRERERDRICLFVYVSVYFGNVRVPLPCQ